MIHSAPPTLMTRHINIKKRRIAEATRQSAEPPAVWALRSAFDSSNDDALQRLDGGQDNLFADVTHSHTSFQGEPKR